MKETMYFGWACSVVVPGAWIVGEVHRDYRGAVGGPHSVRDCMANYRGRWCHEPAWLPADNIGGIPGFIIQILLAGMIVCPSGGERGWIPALTLTSRSSPAGLLVVADGHIGSEQGGQAVTLLITAVMRGISREGLPCVWLIGHGRGAEVRV